MRLAIGPGSYWPAAAPAAPDLLQFAALHAFGLSRTGAEPRASHAGGAGAGDRRDAIAAIDELMDEMSLAEEQLANRLEADLVAVASGPPGDEAITTRLESIESGLAGDSNAARRLMLLLAYRRADLGVDADRAARLSLGALEGAELSEDGLSSPWLFAGGLALGLAGRTHEAEGLFERILQRACSTRANATFTAAIAQRGVERYRRGSLREAIQDLRTALEAARGRPWETMVDDGRATLIRAYADSGQTDLAEHELRVWCATGPLPETTFGTRLLIERARLRLCQGAFDDALADVESVQARLESRADSMIFEWRNIAAITYHRLGRHPEALALADADLQAAEAWGAPRQLAIAHWTLGQIQDGEGGVRHLRSALELLTGSAARLELARIYIGLGAAIRRAGQPGQARTMLRAGVDLARACGARALIEVAEEEIAVSGAVRRRRSFLTGPAALTASEHRVARLAAVGMSNREIAARLVVTRKTVEMHLGNAYRKLDINSRADLRVALLRGEPV